MDSIKFSFAVDDVDHEFEMIFVGGTGNGSFRFGEGNDKQDIVIKDFFISKFLVTQALWKSVMGNGANHSFFKGDDRPVEYVSWLHVADNGGFLDRLNNSSVIAQVREQLPDNVGARFRLPSETEWEYAARGGKHWADGFIHSGSNDIDEVAWHEINSGKHTWPVGQKAPNQLGIYDMNGNLWEWCQDSHTRDTNLIPKDGSPYIDAGLDKILRGGCHHNWAIHCTVSKRYSMIPDGADECIGFRLALSI